MPDHGAALLRLTYANAHERLAEDGRRASAMASDAARAADAINIVNQGLQREQRRLRSLARFINLDGDQRVGAGSLDRLSAALAVRNAAVKGPLAPGGDWLREKAGSGSVSVAIAQVPNSDDVTYEIANFVNGTRTVSDIRDAVSAEFEPLDLKAVAEYLDLLARAGAITFKR